MERKMIYNEEKSSCCFFRSTAQKPNLKVLLQITERCNLKCKHCFVSSLPEGYDLQFEKIEKEIIPKLKKANVTRITLTGGEPMVHKDIYKIIKLLDENGIHITLCTNGLGLSEEKIKKILNNLDINCFAEIRKKRYIYMYNDKYEIALDYVEKLGYFIEIEIKKIEGDYIEERNKLYEIATKLGLNLKNIDLRGYPFYYIKQKE